MDMEKFNAFKEAVRGANPIEEVINEKIQLDDNGKALCPFHSEKTPSFSVNKLEQYYHCFGCGAGGDVFDFIMNFEKVDFKNALKYLAVRKGIQLIEDFGETRLENEKQEIYMALGEATDIYHKNITPQVRSYLNQRGLIDETINRYRLGFCNGNSQFKTSEAILKKAGLFFDSGAEYFKGFITFPHFHYGKVAYISGRGFPEKQHRKLQKEKVQQVHLFNEQATNRKSVIISEGEIDTLTLLQHGFNACGILGVTSFNEKWVGKFKACEKIFLALDNDEAGRKASIEIAWLLGSRCRIVPIPTVKDVNDYFQEHTADDFQKLLDTSLSLIEFRIQCLPSETSHYKLPEILEPILKEISKFSVSKGDAILHSFIRSHFNLTPKEIEGYGKDLNKFRKEVNSPDEVKPKGLKELISILHEQKDVITLHPAQDYANGIMNFAVKIDGQFYLITSDKRLIDFNEAQANGIILSHASPDLSRFSQRGIIAFLEENRELDIPYLYNSLFEYVRRFVHFPNDSYASFISLWVMGTYIFMIFRYYPYIWLNAEKGSGKTLLMEILSQVVFNGELIISPTEAVIFRDISNNKITMLIDEVEQLKKRDKDVHRALISILNVGFCTSGVVKRTENTGKGQFPVKSYNAYSPKMFAGINEIDEVLQDRTIKISLQRKKDSESVERYKPTDEILDLQRQVRDDLYIFALTYGKQIADLYKNKEKDSILGLNHLSNRELDIWEPIMLLANIVDALSEKKGLTDSMATLSKDSIQEKQSDNVLQNETYKLLTVFKEMIDVVQPVIVEENIQVFEAEKVLDFFKKSEEFDWIDKTPKLTRRLKKILIRSEQRRVDGTKTRVYIMDKKKFEDLCERFKI